jgi:hypothetical protein
MRVERKISRVKERGFTAGPAQQGRPVLEAHRAAGSESCGQDTVEGLRDVLQDVLEHLARSRRRRDPVVALKLACKEACNWFSAGDRKRRGRNEDD